MKEGCRSCVDWAVQADWWEDVGCIDGQVYGYCESEFCGGLCDPYGTCPCPCHA